MEEERLPFANNITTLTRVLFDSEETKQYFTRDNGIESRVNLIDKRKYTRRGFFEKIDERHGFEGIASLILADSDTLSLLSPVELRSVLFESAQTLISKARNRRAREALGLESNSNFLPPKAFEVVDTSLTNFQDALLERVHPTPSPERV